MEMWCYQRENLCHLFYSDDKDFSLTRWFPSDHPCLDRYVLWCPFLEVCVYFIPSLVSPHFSASSSREIEGFFLISSKIFWVVSCLFWVVFWVVPCFFWVVSCYLCVVSDALFCVSSIRKRISTSSCCTRFDKYIITDLFCNLLLPCSFTSNCN